MSIEMAGHFSMVMRVKLTNIDGKLFIILIAFCIELQPLELYKTIIQQIITEKLYEKYGHLNVEVFFTRCVSAGV